jgi:hypothetical protein
MNDETKNSEQQTEDHPLILADDSDGFVVENFRWYKRWFKKLFPSLWRKIYGDDHNVYML